VRCENLLTAPERWATLDYNTVDDPDVRAHFTVTVARAGMGHGLSVGFDRTVSGDVYISNAPDTCETQRHVVYGTVFLPWLEPVALAPGDVVSVELEAALVGDNYIWNWKTRVSDRGRSAAEKANFVQSTFFGVPLSLATLHKISGRHTPRLSDEGEIARFVLEAMNGSWSLGEIARRVSKQFPDRFDRPQDALKYVADLSRRYG
jgi:protein arginine N-methyltransferase 1